MKTMRTLVRHPLVFSPMTSFSIFDLDRKIHQAVPRAV
jgi:hypothetical protein